jgi:serine/threonine protein kinase/Tfp pilus assembly protein PilF
VDVRTGALGEPSPSTEASPSESAGSTKPGRKIGPYQLLSVLGEGGFGTVWLAERREPFVQRVALKVIKQGMDSRAVLGRFEQERQSLAMMQHPNIAKVLDGGLTETGQPYFVMEYVRGKPITEFCDSHRLTIRERLALFRQVCEALQHAHQKGVIHRDLKPGNILAFEVERSPPSVKVIDFGVAKATSPGAAAASVFTELGQMVGTFEYMSPEQADGNAAHVDTRSDVYSLGVVLYELLAGVTPLDSRQIRDHGFREMQRIISETDPPPPSTRLSSIADAELKARIIEARQQSENELRRCLRSELEWIPLLAMRKEPNSRYQSAMDLARDIDRYLAGEALQAGPPSLTYRLRKIARRHRGLVAGTAAVSASLVLGLGLALWQWRTAVNANEMADRKAAEATAVKDFVIESLVSADPMQGGRRGFTVRQAMEQAIAALDRGSLKQQPEAEAELQRTIALILDGNAELEAAAVMAERAVDTMERLHGKRSAERARCVDTLGRIRLAQARYPEAERLFTEALEIRQQVLGENDPGVGSSLNNLAETLRLTGRFDEAVPLYERGIAIQTAHLGPDAENVNQAVTNLAITRVNQGDLAQARTLFERALASRRRTLGPKHPKTASAICNLGALHDVALRPDLAKPLYEEALTIREEVVGPDHPTVADTYNNLGSCEMSLQQPAKALPHFEKALRIWEKALGPDHPDVALALGNLAAARIPLGQLDQAEKELHRSMEIQIRALGPDHPDLAFVINSLGKVRLKAGDAPGAERLHREALALFEKTPGGHPDVGATRLDLAVALLKQGRAEEALPMAMSAIEWTSRTQGENFPAVAEAWATVAEIESALAHPAEAEAARLKSKAIGGNSSKP